MALGLYWSWKPKISFVKSNTNYRELIYLIILTVIVYFLRDSQLIFPLWRLGTIFHELGHGLGAILTGGSIREIHIAFDGSGLCKSSGGWRFVVIPAGYLGNMFIGGLLMCWAAHSDQDRKIMRYLGSLLIIISLIYVRPVFGFGFLFCVLTSLLMLALASFAPKNINDFMIKLIGLNSSLQAVFHLPNSSKPESDASKFAELLGGTPYFWAVVWWLIAIISSACFLYIATQFKNTTEELK